MRLKRKGSRENRLSLSCLNFYYQLYCQPYHQRYIMYWLVINCKEWFEFKENWFEPVQLGEYISALSNAAAYHSEETAYFIWGVNDVTHEIVGTNFNQYRDYNKEPYQNYLARNLSPSIGFEFEELKIDGKRVVVLVIPAAKNVPTAFDESRYIRMCR